MRNAHVWSASMKPRSRARRRPIQLAALRGFDAAARHLSFTRAAEELNLTQSSLSRQIASVEEDLGAPLFVRRVRALELTSDGARLAQSVRRALDGIDATVAQIRGAGTRRVTISTFASFASLWLVPRLADFQARAPQIEIRIAASDRFVDLAREDVDFAIRWCLPEDAPHDAQRLGDEMVAPALAPALLERCGHALEQPADLMRLPMLEMESSAGAARGSWARWFESIGISPPPRPQAGKLTFTFIDQSMQAAVRGQGVVMGRTPFVPDLVAAGQLVLPFPDLWLRTGMSVFLIENSARRGDADVALFRDWLVETYAAGPLRQT
jgi:LysR family transcriptional regulator, glycine cleavage system transcriptional activator